MSITILSRISMCADDLVLLDKMASAAGKSRDVFLSDIVFETLTMERMILDSSKRRQEAADG